MQKIKLTALLFACMTIHAARAQDFRIMFQNGAQVPEANLQKFIADGSPAAAEVFSGYYYRFIQFNSIPSDEQKKIIEQSGIILLQYMPHNAYIAAIPVNFTRSMLS